MGRVGQLADEIQEAMNREHEGCSVTVEPLSSYPGLAPADGDGGAWAAPLSDGSAWGARRDALGRRSPGDGSPCRAVPWWEAPRQSCAPRFVLRYSYTSSYL